METKMGDARNNRSDDAIIPATSDWAPVWGLYLGGPEAVDHARKAGLAAIREAALFHMGGAGHGMRGLTLAIAESFDLKDLERGQASTLRGVRNAFSDMLAYKREQRVLTINEALMAIQDVIEKSGIVLPPELSLSFEVKHRDEKDEPNG